MYKHTKASYPIAARPLQKNLKNHHLMLSDFNEQVFLANSNVNVGRLALAKENRKSSLD